MSAYEAPRPSPFARYHLHYPSCVPAPSRVLHFVFAMKNISMDLLVTNALNSICLQMGLFHLYHQKTFSLRFRILGQQVLPGFISSAGPTRIHIFHLLFVGESSQVACGILSFTADSGRWPCWLHLLPSCSGVRPWSCPQLPPG